MGTLKSLRTYLRLIEKEISAIVIAKPKADAEMRLGEKITQAVITTPRPIRGRIGFELCLHLADDVACVREPT